MKISEKFYSVQAEGVTSGVPAYFIRLPGCNLMCGGASGELMKEGKATWWCDSESLWKQFKEVSYKELIDEWDNENIYNDIRNGIIHLVWTGGEPVLHRNAQDILEFLNKFDNGKVFNELETNGTIESPKYWMDKNFYDRFQQINCSPKLSNSGIAGLSRINPGAIRQIQKNPNHWFKFVVSNEDDWKEVMRDYITPFKIDWTRIILMPGCDSQDQIIDRTAFVFEMAKKHRVRAITRAQIMVWGKKPGV